MATHEISIVTTSSGTINARVFRVVDGAKYDFVAKDFAADTDVDLLLSERSTVDATDSLYAGTLNLTEIHPAITAGAYTVVFYTGATRLNEQTLLIQRGRLVEVPDFPDVRVNGVRLVGGTDQALIVTVHATLFGDALALSGQTLRVDFYSATNAITPIVTLNFPGTGTIPTTTPGTVVFSSSGLGPLFSAGAYLVKLTGTVHGYAVAQEASFNVAAA